jgi:hypothetical protein
MSARLIGVALALLLAAFVGSEVQAEEEATPPSITDTEDALEPSEELMGEPIEAADEDTPATDSELPDFETVPDRWRIPTPPYPR